MMDAGALYAKVRDLLWCPFDNSNGLAYQRPFLRWGAHAPSSEALVRGFFPAHWHDSARAWFKAGTIRWEHPTFETFVKRWPHLAYQNPDLSSSPEGTPND